jgi:hypothetical protein
LAEETPRKPEDLEPEEAPRQDDLPSMDDLAEALRRVEVGQFLLSTVSTLASLAYGKLEDRELAQAKLAVDAVGTLLPVLEGHVDDSLYRDFERALANLRVAYADVASAQPE